MYPVDPEDGELVFEGLCRYRRHVDLNNLDWGCKSEKDICKSVWQTLLRVAEKRGLTVERRGLTGQVMVIKNILKAINLSQFNQFSLSVNVLPKE